MCIYSHPKTIRTTAIILFTLCVATFLFAKEASSNSAGNRGYLESKDTPEFKTGSPSSELSWREEENLSALQQQARFYRNEGLKLQHIGNLEGAMSLYQKAIELDPAYAVPYNDLGIIYEAGGALERAEESYLRSIKIDPNYLSAYTNLALLYENKRQLNQAAFYWRKRQELGSPDDPWTEKARQRLKDISLVLSDTPLEDIREQEVIGLVKDVSRQKSILKKDDKALAKSYFEEAKLKFNQNDELTALKLAIDAKQLDPSNCEIEEFVDKVQRRILSR